MNIAHWLAPDVTATAWAGRGADGHLGELAVDDDPRNAEMYRSAGVPTVYLHSGYYDL
ncbi:MAG: hypothetical protein MK187_08355 [Acidimicrobiales bacterium]|nr:hypothetical protein [Acidimicrobiales bacterium]